MRYFKANLESVSFRQIKILFSIKKIEDSGIIEGFKKEKISHLVLFGSSALGLDDIKSDIDLICIGIDKKIAFDILKEKEKIFDKEINMHFFSWNEWKRNAKDNKAFYQDVLLKGINLIGEKPVVDQ